MRFDATWEGNCLCLETVETARKDLPDAWSRIINSGVCLKNLAPLLVWSNMRDLHRSQEFEVSFYPEGAEHETMKMTQID